MRRKKLVHRGVFYARTKINDDVGRREKIFARAWERENEPRNHWHATPDCSTLEVLCRTEEGKLLPITQDTATAVATIFQWLASPVGFSFLECTLKEAGYRVVDTKKEK